MQYLKKRFRFEYGTGEGREQYRANWERIFAKGKAGSGPKDPEDQEAVSNLPPKEGTTL